jgi:hypothetical protein
MLHQRRTAAASARSFRVFLPSRTDPRPESREAPSGHPFPATPRAHAGPIAVTPWKEKPAGGDSNCAGQTFAKMCIVLTRCSHQKTVNVDSRPRARPRPFGWPISTCAIQHNLMFQDQQKGASVVRPIIVVIDEKIPPVPESECSAFAPFDPPRQVPVRTVLEKNMNRPWFRSNSGRIKGASLDPIIGRAALTWSRLVR